MSAARNSLTNQSTQATGVPNYNGALSKGAQVATPNQVAARQLAIYAGLVSVQNDLGYLVNLSKEDLQGDRGPPGPPGQDGIVNVTYSEDIADEFPVFSTQNVLSNWILTDASNRLSDISTSYGFMPLGGLFGGSDSTVAHPIYNSSAANFIPSESSYSTTNPTSSFELPNYVEVPFHNNRIINDISWNCPSGIAARFILVGKPYSGSNYWAKYYQIQGEKIFEEFPTGSSLIVSTRRNTDTPYSYTIPLANSKMPQMKSLAVILYNIRYVPLASRNTYNGQINTLIDTKNIPSNDSIITSQGISVRLVCKNYIDP